MVERYISSKCLIEIANSNSVNFQTLVSNLRSRLFIQTRNFRWRYLTQLRDGEELDFTAFDYVEGVSASYLLEHLLVYGKIGLIHSIDPREPKVHKLHKILGKIYKNQKHLKESLGNKVLYLGYPFVQGKLGDGTLISTPLCLFPLELIYSSGKFPKWVMKCISPPEWNQLFFLLYNQVYSITESNSDISLSLLLEEFKSLSRFLVKLRKELIEHKIELRFPSSIFPNPLIPFRSFLEEEIEPGKLNVYPYAVIGFFYHPSIVYLNAYDELLKHKEYYEKRFSALSSSVPSITSRSTFFLPLQFHPLDHSQLEILNHLFNQGSLVVEGPPGTGKSLTIAHVILNAIHQDRSVLFIAEKWTALQVVYKSLTQAGIDFILPPIQDFDDDRPKLFQHILKIMERIEILNDVELKSKLSFYKHLSHQIRLHCEPIQKGLHILFQPLLGEETPFSLYSMLKKEYAIYNVKKYASLIDKHRLEEIITKIKRLLPYKDLFKPEHPWYHRKNLSSISLIEIRVFEDFLTKDLPNLLEKRKKLKTELVFEVDFQKYDFTKIPCEELEKSWNKYRQLIFPLINEKYVKSFIEYYQNTDYFTYCNLVQRIHSLVSQIQGIDLEKWEQVVEAENLFHQIESFKDHYLKYFFPDYYRNVIEFKKKVKKIVFGSYTQNALSELFGKITQLKRILEDIKNHPLYIHFPLKNPVYVSNIIERLKNVETKIKLILFTPWFGTWIPGMREGKFHFSIWVDDVQKIEKVIELRKEWDQLHTTLLTYLNHEQLKQIEQNSNFVNKLITSFKKDNVRLFELDKIINDFDVTEKEILNIVKNHLSLDDTLWELYLRHSFYLAWIEDLEKNYPELRYFSTDQINSFCKSLKSLMITWIDICNNVVFLEWALSMKPLVNSSLWQKLKRDLSKKRFRPTIKSLLEKYHSILKYFFKYILCKTEEALKFFELKTQFDIVVFDEASQLPLETTFSHLFLGKQLMICGDKHQLPPSRVFTSLSRVESDDIEDSLLDFGIHLFPKKRLLWHYRSEHPILITFSNQHFYDNQLIVLSSPNLPPPSSVLFYHQVNGNWMDQKNFEEAHKVLELLQYYYSQQPIPGIAIITFNFPQQQLIESIIEEWIDTLDPDTYYKLYPYLMGDHEKSLLVRNIERIQGEERDIVIFSIGYGPRPDGSFPAQFGLLNYEGGENRLNVAITRAKKAIHIVASFSPEQLKVEDTKHLGPKLLKSYLFFVYQNATKSSYKPIEDTLSSFAFQDDFVEKARSILEEKGYQMSNLSNFFPFFSKGDQAIIVEGWKMSLLQNPIGRYFHLPWYMEQRNWTSLFVNFRSLALEGEDTVMKIVGQ